MLAMGLALAVAVHLAVATMMIVKTPKKLAEAVL
jgi:hypothetical protein